MTLSGALVGPFTTYTALDFAGRLFYWGIVCGIAILFGVAIRVVILQIVGSDSIRTDMVIAMSQGLSIGPIIWLVNLHLYGFDVGGWAWFLQHVAAVMLSGLLIVAVRDQFRQMRRRIEIRQGAQDSPPSSDDLLPLPDFLSQIEEPIRGPVHLVSADDHYLQVVTSEGSARILMRFRDAMEQLHDWPGYRIHRSHWVAAPRLRRVRVEGRRHVAELTCGAELPVSRAYLDDLRNAGYLD